MATKRVSHQATDAISDKLSQDWEETESLRQRDKPVVWTKAGLESAGPRGDGAGGTARPFPRLLTRPSARVALPASSEIGLYPILLIHGPHVIAARSWNGKEA